MKRKFALTVFLSLCLLSVACAGSERGGTTLSASEKAEYVEALDHEAEIFRKESQALIDEAARQVAEAERVIAEQVAAAEAEKARERAAAAKAAAAAKRAAQERARASRSAPANVGGDVWGALARCESGGNPRAVGGGGRYFGAFQFDLSSWRGAGMSGNPIDYSYGDQLAAAKRWQAKAGWGAWPHCARKLGLR
jgi:membrane protein involved in colicin uptake